MPFSAILFPFFALAAAHPAVLQAGSIGDDDYPAAAREAGQQGAVKVRYLVSIGGAVSDCTVAQSSGSPMLDSRTCELLRQRFHYAPAVDGAGNPVAEWRTQKINWKLPITAAAAASADIASAKRKVEVKVQVAKDGSIDSCQVVTPSGDPKFDLTACRFLGQFGKLDVLRNAAGRPIRSTRIVPVWQ